MAEGWHCPGCGGVHGPHVDSCPNDGYALGPRLRFAPYEHPKCHKCGVRPGDNYACGDPNCPQKISFVPPLETSSGGYVAT